MPGLTSPPPITPVEPVTEILHGVPVTDPYRWLEDQDSPRTREWIRNQTCCARAYLDGISGRGRIRQRIREFLAVETCDSLQKAGNRYFFRKRLAEQEQPCVYMREGPSGKDELLIDPSARGSGRYTAVKPLRASPSGRLLLYEIKEGGERTGTFEILDVDARNVLPDVLPRGYLRGFAFASDEKSFYYVHEPLNAKSHSRRAVDHHALGTEFSEDRETFCAGEGDQIRLTVIADKNRLGFLVHKMFEKTLTSFYLQRLDEENPPACVLPDAEFRIGPAFVRDTILAITDRGAPNLRIVELRLRENQDVEWSDMVPENESRIQQWAVVADRTLVSYIRQAETHVSVFD
ncbi:MAG: hypothetical protein WA581_10460, partial [Candidatus Acidiferrales bacterium]